MAEDVVGHAAVEEASQAAPAVGGHSDEAHLVPSSVVDNRLARLTLHNV